MKTNIFMGGGDDENIVSVMFSASKRVVWILCVHDRDSVCVID